MRPPRTTSPSAFPNRRKGRRAITGATALAALLASAPAAHAACAVTPSSTIFSGLGDTASYSLAPGGNFESGTTGWTLKGASVVSGSDTIALGGAKGTKSLAITPTGTAISAPFCVGIEHPSFRFAARQTSGSWATMLVAIRWTDSTGKVNTTTVGSVNGTSTWTVSASQMLATALPLWQAGQAVTAQIVFDPIDSGGAWAVDDLYIDPYRRS